MSTPAQTPTLAQAIRSKYPGVYDDMDDPTLESKILAKYPQYSDMPRTDPNAHVSAGMRQTMHDMASRPLAPSPLTDEETQQLRQANDARPWYRKALGLGPTDFTGQYLERKSMESHRPGIESGLTDYYQNNPAGMYGMGIASNAAQAGQDFSQGNVKKGIHSSLKAAGIAASPLLVPAIASNPVTTLAALGSGAVGSKVSSGIAKEVGASQDTQDLASDIGGIVAGGAGGYATKLPFFKNLIPSKSAAGALFNQASNAAGDLPIDLTEPGNTALRIRDLASSGGRMPKVVNDFIRRTTDPDKPPITYDEARDFYSNASRISADEAQRLTPVMRFQLGKFTRDLGNSISGAAQQGGVLDQYLGAMRQYRQASQMQDALSGAGTYLTRQAAEKLPWLAAAYGAKKLYDKAK